MQELKKERRYYFSARQPRRILFDHLPKCGGSTLNTYLGKHYPQRRIFSIIGSNPWASVGEFKGGSEHKRYKYDLIQGHHAKQLIDFVHPDCLKVTVLREPIDRIISHYSYARTRPKHYLYQKIHQSNMSLDNYVTSGISPELRNFYTTHFSGLTIDDAESNPEKAINSALEMVLNTYDIVGSLDNFPAFTERLRDQAGLRYKYQNTRENVTKGRVSIDDVPMSTISTIEQVNHLDMILYKKIRVSIG